MQRHYNLPPSVSEDASREIDYSVCHALTLTSRSAQVALSPVRGIAGVGRAWSRRPGSYEAVVIEDESNSSGENISRLTSSSQHSC